MEEFIGPSLLTIIEDFKEFLGFGIRIWQTQNLISSHQVPIFSENISESRQQKTNILWELKLMETMKERKFA